MNWYNGNIICLYMRRSFKALYAIAEVYDERILNEENCKEQMTFV